MAKANALYELVSAFDKVIQSVRNQDEAAGFWDKYVIDATKSLFGGGLLKNAAKEIAFGLRQSMKKFQEILQMLKI